MALRVAGIRGAVLLMIRETLLRVRAPRRAAGHPMAWPPGPLGPQPLVRAASLARGRSGPSGSPRPQVAG